MKDALEQIRTFWFVITIMAGAILGYTWLLHQVPTKQDIVLLRTEVQRYAAMTYADRYRAIEIQIQYLKERITSGAAIDADKLALRQWEAELRNMRDSWDRHAVEFSTPLREVE